MSSIHRPRLTIRGALLALLWGMMLAGALGYRSAPQAFGSTDDDGAAAAPAGGISSPADELVQPELQLEPDADELPLESGRVLVGARPPAFIRSSYSSAAERSLRDWRLGNAPKTSPPRGC